MKEFITKGKVRIVNLRIKDEKNRTLCDFFAFSKAMKNSEAIANTKLIAEAFNVFNESGYTPNELLEKIKSLEKINK
jgi:hypothetical protein